MMKSAAIVPQQQRQPDSSHVPRLLFDAWSSSAGFGAVATALVLAAPRRSASAQSNDRPCSSGMRGVPACCELEDASLSGG